MKRILALFLIASVFMMGCSTLTHIAVTPNDAKIAINDQPAGTGTVTQSLSNFDFSEYNVTITRDGYKPLTTNLKKEFKVGAFVFGLLLWWPELLFVYGPSPNQNFSLDPIK